MRHPQPVFKTQFSNAGSRTYVIYQKQITALSHSMIARIEADACNEVELAAQTSLNDNVI